jgi:hypothetical protein
MRYVMTFMDPKGNRKGGPQMAFKRRAVLNTGPNGGFGWTSQEEVIGEMLNWLDTSPFGRTLALEDIKWAVFTHSESSIVADLTEDEYCILKLAAPTGTVRFRKESTVPIRQTPRERNLTEPMPVSKKPRLGPKPQPDMNIVKKPARRRNNLGLGLARPTRP